MTEKGGLEPPHEVSEDPGAHQLTEPSDSEDSFEDAPSGRQSPKVQSSKSQTSNANVIAGQQQESSETGATAIQNIPKTVVEESSGSLGPHSAEFENKRVADAEPDVVITAGGQVKTETKEEDHVNEAESGDNDDFGDDFDEFEEGGEQHADFDSFDDGFQQPSSSQPAVAHQATTQLSIPDFNGLSPDEILEHTEPLIAKLYPPEQFELAEFPPLPNDSSVFLTTRSASLWSQLVAPPPLAPPDWIRSRTRRLFLVSLGVPVDLDEILPASKQKKLILPSLNLKATSPRTSSDSRALSKLRHGEGNSSSTSVDTQGKPSISRRRKGPPPQPELDLVAGRLLCTATDEALDGMTDKELKTHVDKLRVMEGAANDVLEYWKKRTDEKIGDREAFEGVIENLVKHARKVRK